MAITSVSDAKGALLAYLKGNADLTALCPAANIKGNLSDVAGGSFAIAIVKSGGFPPDLYAPVMRPRMDLHIYGPTAYEAMRLYRLVRGLLEPVTRRGLAFTAANCRVLDVQFESEPIEMMDGEWPKVLVAITLVAYEVPVT